MNKMHDSETKRGRDYDRLMLRSALVSLFWSVIVERRKREKFPLQELADSLKKNKSIVSRWFSDKPNWRLDTISDLANALDVDLLIQARDRRTGKLHSPHGVHPYEISTATQIKTETTSSPEAIIKRLPPGTKIADPVAANG